MEEGQTYRVVKFMVKVRLMEKRVKSQVGRVMVVKVITQYRRPGTTWKKKKKTRPTKPIEDAGGTTGGVEIPDNAGPAGRTVGHSATVGWTVTVTEERRVSASSDDGETAALGLPGAQEPGASPGMEATEMLPPSPSGAMVGGRDVQDRRARRRVWTRPPEVSSKGV